jgi:hypothetical protein
MKTGAFVGVPAEIATDDDNHPYRLAHVTLEPMVVADEGRETSPACSRRSPVGVGVSSGGGGAGRPGAARPDRPIACPIPVVACRGRWRASDDPCAVLPPRHP